MKLDEYLKNQSMTKTAFGAVVGVSQSHISNISWGKKQPSIKLAKKIEEATDGKVSVIELLDINISFNKKSKEKETYRD